MNGSSCCKCDFIRYRLYIKSTDGYNKSMKHKRLIESGAVNGWMISAIGGLILFLIAGSLAIWAYMAYSELSTNVDNKVGVAVAEAKREQAEVDQAKFLEEANNLRLEFVGPEEYGRVAFMYPKTWSVYVSKDGSDRRNFEAYLHPVQVPPTANQDSRYAMRLEILDIGFDKVLDQYSGQLKKGELVSSSVEYNGNTGTRLDGAFTKDLRGAVVLFKVRDKTVRFSTDADTFKPNFKAVLDTVTMIP